MSFNASRTITPFSFRDPAAGTLTALHVPTLGALTPPGPASLRGSHAASGTGW